MESLFEAKLSISCLRYDSKFERLAYYLISFYVKGILQSLSQQVIGNFFPSIEILT